MSGTVQGSSGDVDPCYGINTEPLEARHIDEAVDRVLYNFQLDEGTDGTLREMISRDSNSAVAISYFDNFNAKGVARSLLRVRKAKLFIDYVLTDEQTSTLIEYAPEFDLIFRSLDSHDHPMAAAMRTIDHAVINSRIPATSRVNDVGGDPLFHVRSGNVNVHCCNPDMDVKDNARGVLRRLAIHNMYKSRESYSRQTQVMLDSYMGMGSRHFCSRKAQDCEVRADVITAIHVYDVPMQDWPLIMERKGASLVEGAVLFSDKFLVENAGEIQGSGMRYEIDVTADEFKMGFVGSPGWWYTHTWSEFVRYAVDQRIVHGDFVYSYKVVERRCDTIYFRILAVPAKINERADLLNVRHYKYPSVRLTEVNGFDFLSAASGNTRNKLTRKTFMVATPLWNSLVTTATSEAERGPVDINKMFNAYRTAAPRHTINGVLISGGYSVDAEEVKIVVVHAAIAGTARALLSEKSNRALTAGAFTRRSEMAQSTSRKLLSLLGNIIKCSLLSPLYLMGLNRLVKCIEAKVYDFASINMIAEIYDAEVKSVSCDKIFLADRSGIQSLDRLEPTPFNNLAAASAGHDLLISLESNLELAEHFYSEFGPQLTKFQSDKLSAAINRMKSAQDKKVNDNGMHKSVQEKNFNDPIREKSKLGKVHDDRVTAIKEAMMEVRISLNITSSFCRRVYSQSVTGVFSVDKIALNRDVEANENPDLWKISNGVLANHSERGIPVRDFAHSRVYLGGKSGGCFVKVIRSVWHNPRLGIDEVNFSIEDSDYNGYGLTCDSLMIFNGEEILGALERAVDMDHGNYSVTLEEGPPGCGKTHAIIESYQPTDIVLCPVKQSIDDTKVRLGEKYGHCISSRDCAKTVDSYLMHGVKSDTEFDRILADECFMTHSGKWYACAALLGVKSIKAYGDTKQIPHIPRIQCPKEHVSLRYDARNFNHITRRCPADSVACWGHLYGDTVKTTNSIVNSITETSRATGLQMTNDTCLMGMYQADKKEIRKLYPNHEKLAGPGKIVTTHESEGKTYKHVILFRFDLRVRKDNLSLYDQEPYVLVALSRHTHKFLYVRPNNLGDLVSKFIARKYDPRLVKSVLHEDASVPNG